MTVVTEGAAAAGQSASQAPTTEIQRSAADSALRTVYGEILIFLFTFSFFSLFLFVTLFAKSNFGSVTRELN